jgi:alkanesulfonate monooxygenase SsuD/methylene tetrahydromethanopterin reductase-like flavin-dependent oxidoreductase (luciferase family)
VLLEALAQPLLVIHRSHSSRPACHIATEAATVQKLDWIRQAAGDRFDELELNVMVYAPIVTDDRPQVARQMVARYELTEDEVLGSPHFLIGSVDQIGEDLQRHRERHGISYFVVPEVFSEAFAPVVAQLAGI